jgi:hypothetical protein
MTDETPKAGNLIAQERLDMLLKNCNSMAKFIQVFLARRGAEYTLALGTTYGAILLTFLVALL